MVHVSSVELASEAPLKRYIYGHMATKLKVDPGPGTFSDCVDCRRSAVRLTISHNFLESFSQDDVPGPIFIE